MIISEKDFFSPTPQKYFTGHLINNNTLLHSTDSVKKITECLGQENFQNSFKQINGSFAFAVMNKNKIYFGTDHFGGRPLFYHINNIFFLTDNPTQLPQKKILNDEQICHFLLSGYAGENQTIFNNILECQPGIVYCWNISDKTLKKIQWYKFQNNNNVEPDFNTLNRHILNSIPTIYGDKKYMLPLSGGFDSRTIYAALIKKHFDFDCYTYGFENDNETRIAHEISKNFSKTHYFHPFVKNRDEFFSNNNLSKFIYSSFKGRSLPHEADWVSANLLANSNYIIIPGHTGDFITGGHIDYWMQRIKNDKQLYNYIFYKHFNLMPVYSKKLKEQITSSLKETFKNISYHDFIDAAEQWNLLHRQRKYIINSIQNYLYFNQDVVLPFYNKNLMEYFCSLKYSEKINQRAYKEFLSKTLFTGELKKIQQIPFTNKSLQLNNFSIKNNMMSQARKIVKKLDQTNLRKIYLHQQISKFKNNLYLIKEIDGKNLYRDNIKKTFPQLNYAIEILESQNCYNAVKQLKYIQNKKIAQLHENGLYICKFLPYILEKIS